MNAIQRTFRNATAVFSLRHTSKVNDRIEEARNALRLSATYYRRLDDEIAGLLETPLSGALTESLLDSVYPLKGLEDAPRQRRLGKRAKLLAHYHSSPTVDEIRGTAWGLIQAVTELEQWEPNRSAKAGHAERNLAYQLGVSPNGSASTAMYKTLDLMSIGTQP